MQMIVCCIEIISYLCILKYRPTMRITDTFSART